MSYRDVNNREKSSGNVYRRGANNRDAKKMKSQTMDVQKKYEEASNGDTKQ